MDTKTSKGTSWFTLFAIFGCALIPLVSAFALFFWPPESFSLNTTHHGQLLTPPLSLNTLPFEARPFETRPSDTESLKSGSVEQQPSVNMLPNPWQLVSIQVSDDCQNISNDPLKTSIKVKENEQIIKALGRESHRVTSGVLCLSSPPIESIIDTKDTKLLTGIVDPNNQLIMVYQRTSDQRAIYQDLKRLLKYSKLG